MRIRGDARRIRAERAEPAAKHLLCVVCVLCAMVLDLGCSGGTGLFKQYEYEEEMYLSLDGSATLYVNTSLAALNALRGTTFDAKPSARVDRTAIRTYYNGPNTHVVRVSDSRRGGRAFAHIRITVDDVRALGSSPPFAWSSYKLDRSGQQYIYLQTVGAPVSGAADAAGARWTGQELTAFRMHLPSKIDYHNTPTHEVGRGNILTWEQPLVDRLKGVPLTLEARMETQSILYRTLWLFGITFVVVAVLFVMVIWWVMRKGRRTESLPANG